MLNIFCVGAGGFIGASFRYLTVKFITDILREPMLPYGTMTVNIVGCFLIGLLATLIQERNLFTPELRLFLIAGILGGFTTFSAFGYEVFYLIQEQHFFWALFNVLFQVCVGLLAVVSGSYLARIT